MGFGLKNLISKENLLFTQKNKHISSTRAQNDWKESKAEQALISIDVKIVNSHRETNDGNLHDANYRY